MKHLLIFKSFRILYNIINSLCVERQRERGADKQVVNVPVPIALYVFKTKMLFKSFQMDLNHTSFSRQYAFHCISIFVISFARAFQQMQINWCLEIMKSFCW